MKRKIAVFAGLMALALNVNADITVSDVKVFSGRPWQEVVIGYTISGSINGVGSVRTILFDNDAGIAWTNVSDESSALAEGRHYFKWKKNVCSTNFEVKVQLFRDPTYCVIDLSDGPNAVSYPVTYMDEVPDGGWTKEYKTTKLVLRLLEQGSYIMGSDQTRTSHRVTLTRPFYIGVFEVTQKQWSLVTGESRAYDYGVGDDYPAGQISYDQIRGSGDGANWPKSSAVDATSFLGKLRSKTGLEFDLPTEAQWEYACRAGTTTKYYWGDSMNGNYGWYYSNANYVTHTVGGKRPNAWGLYDMVGNVIEWCLDWYDEKLAYGTDPLGPIESPSTNYSMRYRVLRGGSIRSQDESDFKSYYRTGSGPQNWSINGFRISRTLRSK